MTHLPHHKYLDDYESSGPRPPVPGQESRMYKMTEGQSSSCSQNSPPSFCKWNQRLTYLLEDAEGAEIFKRYVEAAGGVHADRLNFYFACEGLKQQSEDVKVKQMVRAIYKFLRKSQLSITEDLRGRIKNGLANEAKLDPHIFDHMQQDIVRIINDTTYPNFLQSDLYIQHMDNAAQSAAAVHSASTTSSSGSCSASNVPRSSTLPTLHEDTELSIGGGDGMGPVATGGGGGGTGEKPHVRLTKNLLLATQERRLELRPQGAHGYIASFSSSYNPVSRQDSERQSCSSGGVTDSDTKSVSSSRDGRPHYRRQSENKQIQQHAQLNKETNSFVQVPRTHRTNEHFRSLNESDLMSVLIPKLEAIKRDQDTKEKLNQMINEEQPGDSGGAAAVDAAGPSRGRLGPLPPIPPAALTDDIFRKLQVDDDNDQSILDQHVSRVWSDLTPHRSPGTASPCPDALRQRCHDAGIGSDISSIGGQSMRHSRSMPEHSSSRRLTHKWSSVNTDSGISMYSLDPPIKSRDNITSRSRSIGIDTASPNTAFLEEARRRLEDETNRKSRRHSQYPQTTASLPPLVSGSQESTVAVYTFLDEKTPYKLKLPGTQPTLRQFKDYLPKKGSFRFFFKTACEDPDNPVIQEEIVNDMEILPLFDKKVMGLIKPYE